ncbi:MAG: retention module-containing protein, partial [Azonexus sp.]
MAQSVVVAKVTSLSGEAFARDAAGKLRRLKLGDAIREGESVVASDGSQVLLKLTDGREIEVRPGEVAKLDAEVAALVKPDATDSAVADHGKGFEKITKALTRGGSLDALLEEEAPAAGAAQGGNEGHTFVEFLRVVETVDPLSFQFGTNRGAPLESIERAPLLIDNDQPSITTVEPGQPGAAGDTVIEGNDLVYTVTLSTETLTPATYTFNLGGGTAGTGDYTTPPTFSNNVVLNS